MATSGQRIRYGGKPASLIVQSAQDTKFICENLQTNSLPKGILAIMRGTYATIDEQNENGRTYEFNNYFSQVQSLMPKIKAKRLLGELEHVKRRTIKYPNVSHRIESIEWNPKTKSFDGEIAILDTPSGRIAYAIATSGSPLFISSRAIGVVDQHTGKVTLLKLITFDLVAEPGFYDAAFNIAVDAKAAASMPVAVNESKQTLYINEAFDDDASYDEAMLMQQLKSLVGKGMLKAIFPSTAVVPYQQLVCEALETVDIVPTTQHNTNNNMKQNQTNFVEAYKNVVIGENATLSDMQKVEDILLGINPNCDFSDVMLATTFDSASTDQQKELCSLLGIEFAEAVNEALNIEYLNTCWQAIEQAERAELLRNAGFEEAEKLAASNAFNEIAADMQQAIADMLVNAGKANGDLLNIDEAKTAEQVWDGMTPSQRDYYVDDRSFSDAETRKIIECKWSELDDRVKGTIAVALKVAKVLDESAANWWYNAKEAERQQLLEIANKQMYIGVSDAANATWEMFDNESRNALAAAMRAQGYITESYDDPGKLAMLIKSSFMSNNKGRNVASPTEIDALVLTWNKKPTNAELAAALKAFEVNDQGEYVLEGIKEWWDSATGTQRKEICDKVGINEKYAEFSHAELPAEIAQKLADAVGVTNEDFIDDCVAAWKKLDAVQRKKALADSDLPAGLVAEDDFAAMPLSAQKELHIWLLDNNFINESNDDDVEKTLAELWPELEPEQRKQLLEVVGVTESDDDDVEKTLAELWPELEPEQRKQLLEVVGKADEDCENESDFEKLPEEVKEVLNNAKADENIADNIKKLESSWMPDEDNDGQTAKVELDTDKFEECVSESDFEKLPEEVKEVLNNAKADENIADNIKKLESSWMPDEGTNAKYSIDKLTDKQIIDLAQAMKLESPNDRKVSELRDDIKTELDTALDKYIDIAKQFGILTECDESAEAWDAASVEDRKNWLLSRNYAMADAEYDASQPFNNLSVGTQNLIENFFVLESVMADKVYAELPAETKQLINDYCKPDAFVEVINSKPADATVDSLVNAIINKICEGLQPETVNAIEAAREGLTKYLAAFVQDAFVSESRITFLPNKFNGARFINEAADGEATIKPEDVDAIIDGLVDATILTAPQAEEVKDAVSESEELTKLTTKAELAAHIADKAEELGYDVEVDDCMNAVNESAGSDDVRTAILKGKQFDDFEMQTVKEGDTVKSAVVTKDGQLTGIEVEGELTEANAAELQSMLKAYLASANTDEGIRDIRRAIKAINVDEARLDTLYDASGTLVIANADKTDKSTMLFDKAPAAYRTILEGLTADQKDLLVRQAEARTFVNENDVASFYRTRNWKQICSYTKVNKAQFINEGFGGAVGKNANGLTPEQQALVDAIRGN